MTDRKSRISYLANINKYLASLAKIVGKEVKREDLLSLEEVEKLRQKKANYLNYSVNRHEVSFSCLTPTEVQKFFEELYLLNKKSTYLWIEGSNECGLLMLPSIKSINYSFLFDPGLIQILTFSTVDLEDRLLLDIDLNEDNQPLMLTIESQGKNWSSIKY